MAIKSLQHSSLTDNAFYRSVLAGNTYYVPPFDVDYLVVAGAGGGGGEYGGGGGAGGYRTSAGTSGGSNPAESVFSAVPATSYTVTVGAGGTGGVHVNTFVGASSGASSTFGSKTTPGGVRVDTLRMALTSLLPLQEVLAVVVVYPKRAQQPNSTMEFIMVLAVRKVGLLLLITVALVVEQHNQVKELQEETKLELVVMEFNHLLQAVPFIVQVVALDVLGMV
jgi:hypothetical protein